MNSESKSGGDLYQPSSGVMTDTEKVCPAILETEVRYMLDKIAFLEKILHDERKEMDDRLTELTLMKEREIEQIRSHWESKVSQLVNCQNSTIIHNITMADHSLQLPHRQGNEGQIDQDILQMHTYSSSVSDCLTEVETLRRENKELKEVLAATRAKYSKRCKTGTMVSVGTQTSAAFNFDTSDLRQRFLTDNYAESIVKSSSKSKSRGPKVLTVQHKKPMSVGNSLIQGYYSASINCLESKAVIPEPQGPVWQVAAEQDQDLAGKSPLTAGDSLAKHLAAQVSQLQAALENSETSAFAKHQMLVDECQELKGLLQDCLIDKNRLQSELVDLQAKISQSTRRSTTKSLVKSIFENSDAKREIKAMKGTKNRDEIRNMIFKKNSLKESFKKLVNTHSRGSIDQPTDGRSASNSCPRGSTLEFQGKKSELAKILGDWIQGRTSSIRANSRFTVDTSVSTKFTPSSKTKASKYPGTRKTSPSKHPFN